MKIYKAIQDRPGVMNFALGALKIARVYPVNAKMYSIKPRIYLVNLWVYPLNPRMVSIKPRLHRTTRPTVSS